jgi:hypothetical protein
MFSEVAAQGVDHLGALADEHLLRAKQHGAGLLVFRLHCDKPQGWAQCRLDNGIGIRCVVFLALDERLGLDRRDQAHRVAKILEFASPAMGGGASLLSNNASRLPSHERQ